MKGIVLAGGTGSRLFPLTKITNKHLLPIYDKPMIFYPIQALVDAGIRDILLVTGGRNSGDFLRLLANGKEFGLAHLNYTYQEGEGGIADALALAEHFADGEKICVILGDNIIQGSIKAAVQAFEKQERGARILLKEVHDAGRFGVAELAGDRILGIEEKPAKPKSNYAVTGLYFYDGRASEFAKTLKPSHRGELEITALNQVYLDAGELNVELLGRGFAWLDTGTHDSLIQAGEFIRAVEQRQGLRIGCLEEIAFRRGWIDAQQLRKAADVLAKSEYGQYLRELAEQPLNASDAID